MLTLGWSVFRSSEVTLTVLQVLSVALSENWTPREKVTQHLSQPSSQLQSLGSQNSGGGGEATD